MTVNNKNKTLASFNPIVVPMSGNETLEEFRYRWKKFDALPEETKDKLSSKEIPEILGMVQKTVNLDVSQIANATRAIRAYYFGDLKIEEMPLYISHRSNIDQAAAERITKIIVERIIQNDKMTSAEPAVRAETISFPVALKKYPMLGEQAISSNPIKIKYFENSVRPSIKNWITDYQQLLGVGRHEAIARANFIFKSENGKRLTPSEREKLAFVLKALDEELEVKIDPVSQQLIFPKPETTERRPVVASAPESLNLSRGGPLPQPHPAAPRPFAPAVSHITQGQQSVSRAPQETEGIEFSSPHQFPAEMTASRPVSQTPENRAHSEAANSLRISPVSNRYEDVEHHGTQSVPTAMPQQGLRISGNTVNLREK